MSNTVMNVVKSKFSLKRFNENTKRRNKRFVAKDRMGQRVTIAKDVLTMLDLKKLTAKRGTYVHFGDYIETPAHDASCEVLFGLAENCKVCALGAVFMGAVSRGAVDGCDTDVLYGDDYAMRKLLSPYFTNDELWAMENYFESGYSMGDDSRLRAVMEAIVESKGERVVPLIDESDPNEDF